MIWTTPELDDFIAANLNSVEQLEILLLLFRSPDTYWATEAISQHLSIAASVTDTRLRELVSHGLVCEGQYGGIYRLDTTTESVSRIEALAAIYKERPIAVINAIYSANLTRLRSFADAFRLGGKKPE